MAAGLDTARAFLEPMPEPPSDRPMPRRGFLFGVLFSCVTAVTGGIALMVHSPLGGPGHPVPKPGPRRYPPNYHRPRPAH